MDRQTTAAMNFAPPGATFAFESRRTDYATPSVRGGAVSTVYECPARNASALFDAILSERTDPQEAVSVRVGTTELPKRAHIARIQDIFEETVARNSAMPPGSDTPVTVRIHRPDPQAPMQLLVEPRTFQFASDAVTARRELSKIVLSHNPARVRALLAFGSESVFPAPLTLESLRSAYEFARTTPLGATAVARNESIVVRIVLPNAVASAPTGPAVSVPSPVVATPTPPPASQQREVPTPLALPSHVGGPPSPQVHGLAPSSKMYASHLQQDAAQRNFQHQFETPEQTSQRRRDQPPAHFLSNQVGAQSMYYELGSYGSAPRVSGAAPSLPLDMFST